MTKQTKNSQIIDIPEGARSPRVFIAYCREDTQHTLLVEQIIKDLRNNIPNLEVFYDKQKKHALFSLSEFEKKILQVDLVIVLCTEQYKKIIDTRDANRHAFNEYGDVKILFNIAPHKVCPLMLSGTVENSVPSDLREIEVYQLTNIRDIQKEQEKKNHNKVVLNTYGKKQYKSVVDSIKGRLYHNYREYLIIYPAGKDSQQVYNDLFVFKESNNKLPEKCMIVPDAYSKMFADHKQFIVGRKGSGKSTFFEILVNKDSVKFNTTYKSLNVIKFDLFPIQQVFSIWKEYTKDGEIYQINNVFDLFWEIYIFLYSVCIIGISMEYDPIHWKDDPRCEAFQGIIKQILSALNRKSLLQDHQDPEALFGEIGGTTCDIIEDFLAKGILDRSTEKSFRGSILANMKSMIALYNYFGENCVKLYVQAIKKCKRYILFALDGFDSTSDDFRQRTNMYLESKDENLRRDGEQRKDFLRDFDYRLVDTVNRLKSGGRKGIFDVIDICIILPRDRYEVFRVKDRDIAKKDFSFLNWDAFELMQMITLRLEYLRERLMNEPDLKNKYPNFLSQSVNISKLSYTNSADLYLRFVHCMQQLFPDIPLHINIDSIGKIELFNYLLSLSMWRPRDIIKYFEKLFEISKRLHSMDCTNEEINLAIRSGMSNTSITILDDEFIGEYKTVFRNIEDVLNCLRAAPLFLTGEEIKIRLNKIDFITTFAIDDGTFSSKLRILYELGVIGVCVTREMMERFNLLSEHCFAFNQGSMPQRPVNFDESTMCVFNPMFKSKLGLMPNFSKEGIIGNFSWSDIKKAHLIKSTMPQT
jgi:hypothetical protein